MQQPGLRARKRQQTHDTIVAAALRVFQARGYDAATLDDVAEAAEIARRTLLRYFPSKSHLLLHRAYQALDEFRQEMGQRGDRPVLDVWEAHVRTHTQRRLENAQNRETSVLTEVEPSLASEQLKINREYHEILAAALMTEVDSDYSADAVSNVIAGGLVSGQSALYRHLIHEGSYAANVDRIFQVIQLGRDMLAHLARRRPDKDAASADTPADLIPS